MARSFSFLSKTSFLVPCTMNDKYPLLCIYELPPDASTIEPALVANYHLPALKPNCLECGIVCRADPAPWAPPPRHPAADLHATPGVSSSGLQMTSTSEYRPRHPRPFGPAPSSRIIVLSMSIITSIFGEGEAGLLRIEARNYVTFIKAETLLTQWKSHTIPADEETQATNMVTNCPHLIEK